MKLLYLYSDLMNLYGESGNIRVLERHLIDQGFSVFIEKKSLGEPLIFDDYDFIYCGSGTEKSQKAALKHLLLYRENFIGAINNGTVALFTGNSGEMLGKNITDSSGTVYPGIGLLDFESEEQNERYTGDVICSFPEISQPLVGFINKCSNLKGVSSPFLTMEYGRGNTATEQGEGFFTHNLYATHLIGPILVKNPSFMAWLIQKITSKEKEFCYQPISYEYEEKAYQVTYSALKERKDAEKSKG